MSEDANKEQQLFWRPQPFYILHSWYQYVYYVIDVDSDWLQQSHVSTVCHYSNLN